MISLSEGTVIDCSATGMIHGTIMGAGGAVVGGGVGLAVGAALPCKK